MKKLLQTNCLFAMILAFLSTTSFAQHNTDNEYQQEFTWGVTKNTSSGLIGGFVFKYNKAIKRGQYRHIGLELVNVKHPKENTKTISATGNPYTWQKENYLFVIRMQYGREVIMFRKASQQGVQISAIGSGGPSLGLLSPYYIKYGTMPQAMPFDPKIHREYTQVYGRGSMFQGLPESKFALGANVKAALNLELGNFQNNITGFEVGILAEIYTSRVPIMSDYENNIKNKFFFPTAFITLYYGRRK